MNYVGSNGVGICLWGDNDNNQILDNEIYNNDRQGIFIGHYDTTKISSGNTVSGNEIYNNGLYTQPNGPDASMYGVQLWNGDENTIKDNEIYNHDDWFPYGGDFDFAQGIYLCAAFDNIVTRNDLHDNNYGAGAWSCGRTPAGSNQINCNAIYDNTGYGVINYDSVTYDATNNWWGSATGPTHSGNTGGTGDDVSDNVDFDPWLATPSSPCITMPYGDKPLSGGFQADHFDRIWDLTACDLVISFTYDGNGLVDDSGAHAWAELGVREVGYADFNPTFGMEGAGVWLATDYDWTAGTFDPDPPDAPTLDLDDKLILQKAGGNGEGDYNLPSAPPNPWANHRVWWDRDGVDPWQNDETANTGGIYEIVITLHATSDTSGEAHMTINGLDQGFETDGNWDTIELTPAGMTFTGDMTQMQVFYGLYGYGATHSVTFENITVTGCLYIAEVDIDIKPGSWPNCVNPRPRGVLSVAVLGNDAFDVNDIDPGSVELDGIDPIRWSIEDVNGDLFDDLVFKFHKADLVTLIKEGEVLSLSGKFTINGTTVGFVGSDVVYLPGGDVCETTAALTPGWDIFCQGGGSVSWEYSADGSEVTVTYSLQDVPVGQYHVYPDFFNPGDLEVDPGVHVGDLWGDVSYFTHGNWTREGNKAYADVWTGVTVTVTALESTNALYTFSAEPGSYFVQFAVAPGNSPGSVAYRTGTAYGVGFEELVFK